MPADQRAAGRSFSALELGVFDWIDQRPAPPSQMYEERLQRVEAADAAGCFCHHLAEHHLGLISIAPSPKFLT